jgi:hypothetical protein
MTMVSSGPISLAGNATTGGLNQSINIELGQSATATISLNDSNVRTLLGVPSGAISLNDAYGKSNIFYFTVSSNQTNANLRTLAVNAGWNQTTKVVATVASNVYVYSTSTGTPGLTINGSFPNGVELVNNGFIMGMGGAGGNGGQNGSSGGTAISLGLSCTIENNSYIGGGGGGGAGSFDGGSGTGGGGGGAGGGDGGIGGNNVAPGGAGGGPGSSGANGTVGPPGGKQQFGGGGGGGRIMPGTGGAGAPDFPSAGNMYGRGGGSGGGGGNFGPGGRGSGGAGGSAGNAGQNGNTASGGPNGGGGGGGYGASGGSGYLRSGGSGGLCVALNGNTATFTVTGTRYGSIS